MRFLILIFTLLLGACAAHPQKAQEAPPASQAVPGKASSSEPTVLKSAPGPSVRAIAIGTLSTSEFDLETGGYWQRAALALRRAAGQTRDGVMSKADLDRVIALCKQSEAKLREAEQIADKGKDMWPAARDIYGEAEPTLKEAEEIIAKGASK
jgi:hypothetical protein